MTVPAGQGYAKMTSQTRSRRKHIHRHRVGIHAGGGIHRSRSAQVPCLAYFAGGRAPKTVVQCVRARSHDGHERFLRPLREVLHPACGNMHTRFTVSRRSS